MHNKNLSQSMRQHLAAITATSGLPLPIMLVIYCADMESWWTFSPDAVESHDEYAAFMAEVIRALQEDGCQVEVREFRASAFNRWLDSLGLTNSVTSRLDYALRTPVLTDPAVRFRLGLAVSAPPTTVSKRERAALQLEDRAFAAIRQSLKNARDIPARNRVEAACNQADAHNDGCSQRALLRALLVGLEMDDLRQIDLVALLKGWFATCPDSRQATAACQLAVRYSAGLTDDKLAAAQACADQMGPA